MKGSTLPAKALEGRDLAMELEIVRDALEKQSQLTLKLASQVATLGAKAERLSATKTVSANADDLGDTPQFDKMMALPAEEEVPDVRSDVESDEPDETVPSHRRASRATAFIMGRGLFQSPEELQAIIQSNLREKPYNVANYYKETGMFQAIAKNHYFELASLALVIGSSFWMAVDIDFNNAAMLHEADIGFQLVANSVCFLFTAELLIRFLAFENKRNIVHDFWCMFDLILVTFMVVETWVLWLLIGAFGFKVSGGNIRILGVLRMMRLARIMRLAKLFRFVPELLVIIRGIGIALRAISLVFALLGMVVYMGAIAFRVLLENSAFGKELFGSVPQAMGTLLLDCALSGTKGGALMREAYKVNPLFSFLMFCFALIANVTMMGVLSGLLVQTIKKVAELEEEEKRIMSNLATMDDFWVHLMEMDSNNDGNITHEEFLELMCQARTLKLLKRMDVDPEILVALSDFMFDENNGRLSQSTLNQWVLDLRTSQKGTLKDHYMTRKFIKTKLHETLAAAPKEEYE